MRTVRRLTVIFLISVISLMAIASPLKPQTESVILKETVINIEATAVAQADIWNE